MTKDEELGNCINVVNQLLEVLEESKNIKIKDNELSKFFNEFFNLEIEILIAVSFRLLSISLKNVISGE